VLGLAIEATLLAGVTVESEFGGDDDLAAERGEGFADEFFIGEGAVDFGRVEEGDALLDGGADDGDHLLLFPAGP